ncbi:DeoR/GlpR family DNA-binding transcription regulator [Marinactinospora rubrisoli]|uniref:Lactose phosphotransferase system repressor n=1 Tax=Marinactinospora rubrisoli TaxID=2715399 RepID=A0ABW2KJB7_9ACTN
MNAELYAPERHQEILTRARERGRINVRRLAQALEVAPETIRRDLAALERHGMLRRVHGGAMPVDPAWPPPFGPLADEGDAATSTVEERVARTALATIPDSGAILLDAGSITPRLAALLPRDRDLTVITASLHVAALVADRPGIHLHVLGGRVLGRSPAATGPWTISGLDDLWADVAFLEADGITPDGVTATDPDRADVQRSLLRAARRAVVLADHSKFGGEEPAAVTTLDAVDRVVSDTDLDPQMAEAITAAGTRIELA